MYVSKNGVVVKVNPTANLVVSGVLILIGLVCVGHIGSVGSVLIGAGLIWVGVQSARRTFRLLANAQEAYLEASNPRRKFR